MKYLLKYIYFISVVHPVIRILIGLNVRHGERIPHKGPAILIANHNSHLDTMVLMCLFPLRILHRIRPVAAAEYFLKTRLRAWFFSNVIGIIPISRHITKEEVHKEGRFLEPISRALRAGDIVIFYPEGSRGSPEEIGRFKRGIGKLAAMHPEVPVYPFFIHGAGKALPRGEGLLVPFFCDVFVGDPITFRGTRASFTEELRRQVLQLAHECPGFDEADDHSIFA